jgi:hypothetical protein
MPASNDIITTTLEHSASGTFRFIDGTICIPVASTLPSGIQNQILFIQTSGILALYDGTSWLTRSAE